MMMKPYLFVHEADRSKGGDTFDALKMELKNQTHRRKLFDESHPPVTWHRISDFQVVSLIQIAQDMLKHSPKYVLSDLQLYIPGTLLEQRFEFPTPVILYVSENNPGAAEAATEMQTAFRRLKIASWLPRTAEMRQSWLPDIRGSITSALHMPIPDIRGSIIGALNGPPALQLKAESSRDDDLNAPQAEPQATHFLLYLNQHTFMEKVGETLAGEVRRAMASRLPIAMIHENDSAREGCEFATFFEITPKDLIDGGLYRSIAIAFMPGEAHRSVSRALLAKNHLGARVASHRGFMRSNKSEASNCSHSNKSERSVSRRASRIVVRSSSAHLPRQSQSCPASERKSSFTTGKHFSGKWLHKLQRSASGRLSSGSAAGAVHTTTQVGASVSSCY